jgi:hypothetical protein
MYSLFKLKLNKKLKQSILLCLRINLLIIKNVPLPPCRRQGGEGYFLLILDLGTRWGEWLTSRPGRALAPGKGPSGTDWIGGWVDPGAGPDTEATGNILCLCRGSNSGRLVYSQTLY